tara:strand:+ start:2186 stop:2410 length:225 start_codon:yes stop_codon:yes gene_type:complete
MNINDQTDAFLFELQNVVNKFRLEFDLNHATIVGTLEMVKMEYLIDPSGDVNFESDIDLDDEINDEEEGDSTAF